ncbi:MAG: WD40 repeat domain-containing protein [Spirochaetes bacterium]|nr:MAG: WD40 repeat domain-containing protein [Spirochaetota bacterium]
MIIRRRGIFTVTLASLCVAALVVGCASQRKAPVASEKLGALEAKAKQRNPNEPPDYAMLRIGTEMHTTRINRIAIDAMNRYVATASNDKTVKVWEIATGKLVTTLRPPIGEGNEGKIYAVAITPDGSTIACTGWTGWDWNRNASIYFFNTQSGALLHKLDGFPGVIFNLVYSRDGSHLAVCLEGSYGMRVYRTAGFELVGSDSGYGAQSNGGDFDARGRLVTTSYDGSLRLYDEKFDLIKKISTKSSKDPSRVAFSPDGSLIAVGFDRQPKVDVYSGEDLEYQYSPDTEGAKWGLFSVGWSIDGATLYAGGSYDNNGVVPLLKWAYAGKGPKQELAASSDSIQQILPLANGNVLFCTSEPSWGVFNPWDQRVMYVSPPISNFRFKDTRFSVSRDGSMVLFGLTYNQKEKALFSLRDRALTPAPVVIPDDLERPRESSESIKIINWKHNLAPSVNGATISLDRNEASRSVAVQSDGSGFLLGADWYLRYFDASGNPVWKVPAPGVAWDVNLSDDGRFAIAAFGDGTIRWFRVSDGSELLALFPHSDGRRWVVWTPRGYFDASDKGDELIGWHINQGMDREALYFPAFAFADELRRPEIIDEVLRSADTDDTVTARLQVNYPDVSELIPGIMGMIEKNKAAGEKNAAQVASVHQVHARNNQVIIASGKIGESLKIGDRVYVMLGDTRVTLEVIFPMQTVAKCMAVGQDVMYLRLLTPGMPVFK